MMRRFVLCAIALAVFSTAGCSTFAAVPNLTSDVAQAKTTALIDDVVAAIDPDLIDSMLIVTDEPLACYGTDVDPDQSIVAWQHRRYVYLVEGAPQLDILNAAVASVETSSWSIGHDVPKDDTGGRDVQLVTSGESGTRYGLNLTSGANGYTPAIINVSSNSPCYETK